jgi:hypothetical protein
MATKQKNKSAKLTPEQKQLSAELQSALDAPASAPAKASAPVSQAPAKGKGKPAGKAKRPEVITPKASVELFDSLKLEFPAETEAWIVRPKPEARVFGCRVADPKAIAVCLFAKLESMEQDKEKMKARRASFDKLLPEKQAPYLHSAGIKFKLAMKGFFATTKALKKAVFESGQFSLHSVRINLTKAGNVGVSTRHVHVAPEAKAK